MSTFQSWDGVLLRSTWLCLLQLGFLLAAATSSFFQEWKSEATERNSDESKSIVCWNKTNLNQIYAEKGQETHTHRERKREKERRQMFTNSVDKNPGEYEYTKKKRPTWIIRHSCLYIYTNNHTSLALEQHTTTCKQNVYMKTNCFQYTKCVYHQCVWRKKKLVYPGEPKKTPKW